MILNKTTVDCCEQPKAKISNNRCENRMKTLCWRLEGGKQRTKQTLGVIVFQYSAGGGGYCDLGDENIVTMQTGSIVT